MHFIFGGRYMGMLEYALELQPGAVVCDLAQDGEEGIGKSDVVFGIHLLVQKLLRQKTPPLPFFMQNLASWQGKILIGDEVGSGVVPVEPFERQWRDEVGRVYQLLAREADDVTRVWAGIPQPLKRSGLPV